MDIAAKTCAEIVARHFEDAEYQTHERLTGGVSADVFRVRFQLHGEVNSVVLRIHGESHSGHGAELEFNLLKAVYRAGVPAAEPFAVDTSGTIITEHYLLIEFVDGSTKVSADFADEAIDRMAGQLLKLHAEAPSGLPDLPERLEPMPLMFEWLKGEEWSELVAQLRQIESRFAGEPVLLHGDYWPQNVMWRNSEIVAIVDWEDAAIGDPLSDVACCYVELSYIYGPEGSDKFLKAYVKSRPFDMQRFYLWLIHVSSAAACYMENWGLPKEKEQHMRKMANRAIRYAGSKLMA